LYKSGKKVLKNVVKQQHPTSLNDNERSDKKEKKMELVSTKRRHDIRHNDIQHNIIQHNDIQHNDIQHNDIQHNDT
jgi:hypothetical protein